jgi:nitroimidazol reductase NimA-like FMN-containing flavoprotein (pyridoxamine 5'-phosphate oxidase superfamily)
MSQAMTAAAREKFLAAAWVGVLAVASDAGPQLVTPMWYDYAPGGLITFIAS